MGVAFGIDFRSQWIGDVLVSKKILPYCENKQDAGKLKPVRNQDKSIDNFLHMRFSHVNGFLDNVTYGDILTGGTVLSDVEVKDTICLGYATNDFIIGGEMEGNALFQIAQSDEIPCAVIKGICDWGVIKNNVFEEKADSEYINPNDLYHYSYEEKFKDSCQAHAMQCVIDKSMCLFNDGGVFRSGKAERKIALKKRGSNYKWCLILSLLLVGIVGGGLLIFKDRLRESELLFIGLTFIIAAIFLAIGASRIYRTFWMRIKKAFVIRYLFFRGEREYKKKRWANGQKTVRPSFTKRLYTKLFPTPKNPPKIPTSVPYPSKQWSGRAQTPKTAGLQQKSQSRKVNRVKTLRLFDGGRSVEIRTRGLLVPK